MREAAALHWRIALTPAPGVIRHQQGSHATHAVLLLQANGKTANGDHHPGKAADAAAAAEPEGKPAKAGGRALRSRKVAVDAN